MSDEAAPARPDPSDPFWQREQGDAYGLAGRMIMKKHAFQNLSGEKLDQHLKADHGWDDKMLSQRGAVASQRDPEMKRYAEQGHQNMHDTAHLD